MTSSEVPSGYSCERGTVLLYRYVSMAEYEDWRTSGELRSKEGGMFFGKHFTCSVELARAWGRAFAQFGDSGEGRVLCARIPLAALGEIHFDARADGIGPQCVAPFSVLATASIREVP
jgi:hypothetical protein